MLRVNASTAAQRASATHRADAAAAIAGEIGGEIGGVNMSSGIQPDLAGAAGGLDSGIERVGRGIEADYQGEDQGDHAG